MPLCRLLEAQGASPFRLPAVEIKPLADRHALAARLGALEQFDLIIFSSSNAVRFGAMLLEQKRDLPLAAIGPATARALNHAGYRVAVQPTEGFDSESLLRHPKLNAVAGARVLLVKGSGGRELLQGELTRRGADVAIANVYRREPAQPSVAELAALEARFAARAIQVITATSAEIAGNLLDLATPALRSAFEPWSGWCRAHASQRACANAGSPPTCFRRTRPKITIWWRRSSAGVPTNPAHSRRSRKISSRPRRRAARIRAAPPRSFAGGPLA